MNALEILQQPNFFDQYAVPWTIKIITTAAIWFIGKWVANHLANLVRRVMTRASMDITLVQFLGNVFHAVLLVVVTIAALDHFGVPTTSILAVFGAASLAVGLALRDSLSNFAAGIMLILFRPFRVGDQIEAGGISGAVEDIRMFSTIIRTADNRQITVPNGHIAKGAIVNFSSKPTRRIDLLFALAPDNDLAAVKQIVTTTLTSNPRVLREPPPSVALADLTESSMRLEVKPWVKTEDHSSVRAELLEQIKNAFDMHSVRMPQPHYHIVIRHNNSDTIPSQQA